MSFQVEAKFGTRDGERAAWLVGALRELCRERGVTLNEVHSHPLPKLELIEGGGGEDGAA